MKNCTFVISILLLICSHHTYAQTQDVAIYALEDQLDVHDDVKKVCIPDQNTVHVSGPIDRLLVDRAYYTGLPTTNIIVSFEDEHSIKTTFFQLPVSFLHTISEETAFDEMWENLNTLCQQPTQKEYTDALESCEQLNKVLAEKFVLTEARDISAAMVQKGFDLLKAQDQLSDIEFVQQLVTMMVYNASTYNPKDLYQNISFYEKNEDIQEKVKEFIPLLQTIDQAICFTTPTIINNIINTIKAMNLDWIVLFQQSKESLNVIMPEMMFYITDNTMLAWQTIMAVVMPKILRGVLAINFGTTFAQYHAKRTKEVDYIILEKMVQQHISEQLLQDGPITFVVDEKTVGTITLSEDVMTGESYLKIECVTTV